MTPFRALYGYDALYFTDIVFGESWAQKAKDWILESQDILKALKDNLLTMQNQQKIYADRHQAKRDILRRRTWCISDYKTVYLEAKRGRKATTTFLWLVPSGQASWRGGL